MRGNGSNGRVVSYKRAFVHMMVIYDGNGFISSRDYSSRSARGINIVFFKQFHKSGNSESE